MAADTKKPAAAKKPTAKKPATPRVSRAQAQKAIAEQAAAPRTTTFRGVQLTLPAVLPAAFAFDVAEVQDADGEGLLPVRRLMVNLIGREQWDAVRNQIAGDHDDMDGLTAIVQELFTAILDPYGVNAGK